MDVSRSGSTYRNYQWTVTFTNPRGLIPTLRVNTTTIIGENATATVVKIQNGSESELWFDAIPAWMTEAPLSVATGGNVSSNVEVYVKTIAGDTVKASCDLKIDNSEYEDYAYRFLNSSEDSCEYVYSSASTPLIRGYKKTIINNLETTIEIFGNYFLPTTNYTARRVTTTIGGVNCNITMINTTYIACNAYAIPWGGYYPQVLVPGYGLALILTTEQLRFEQEIDSISPVRGSFAGGQILTISGRGFRSNATIMLQRSDDGLQTTCEMITWASDKITCRVSPTPAVFTYSPSSLPSSTPSTQPLASPSTGPSSRPTSKPSVPTSVPTTQPSRPTVSPTEEPTEYPTFAPTHVPSASPSAAPSATPTATPSAAPSADPSAVPSASPSETPSQVPSAVPSETPSFVPTAEPTPGPSDVPSESPSATPSEVPSAAPSANPSAGPSVEPSQAPTWTITDVPTATPSYINTESPTEEPTEEPNGVHTLIQRLQHHVDVDVMQIHSQQRRLTADTDSQNAYQIYVDGMTADVASNAVYTYASELTPVISAISPSAISSAVTTNITISGNDLLTSSLYTATVTVAGQSCLHVRVVSTGVLGCTLLRNKNFGGYKSVNVTVYLDNIGYAGLIDYSNALPSIERGFGIYGVVPNNGSLMGGNTLIIRGHGFMSGYPARHTVSLKQMGVAGYTDYDELLLQLGLAANLTYPAQTTLTCNTTSVTETMLTCILPSHDDLYTNGIYAVTVSVNSVTSTCTSATGNCTYKQDELHTPVLYGGDGNVTILSSNANGNGEYQVNVKGYFNVYGWSGFPTITIQDQVTTLNTYDDDSYTFTTQSLYYGLTKIEANFEKVGNAYSEANFTVDVVFESFTFASTNGSVGGGSVASVHGRGFHPDCTKNYLSVTATIDGEQISIPVQEYITCTTTDISFRMPSILDYIPAAVKSNRVLYYSFYADVAAIHFNVSNVNLATTSFSPAQFMYSLAASPVAVVNVSSAFANEALGITVTSSSLSSSVYVDAVKFALLNDDSSFASSHIVSVAAVSPAVAIVPELPASSLNYNMLIEVPPYGYAIANVSLPVKYPPLRSKYSIDTWTSTLTTGVEGRSNLTITGRGLTTSGAYVTVCGDECTRLGSSYSEFTCRIPQHKTEDAATSLDALDLNQDSIQVLDGTYFSSLNSPTSSILARVHDDDYETYFTHTSSSCFVGLQLPADTVALPYRILFYPRPEYQNNIKSFVFEGKAAGSTTYQTIAMSYGAKAGWNYVDAANLTTTWFTAFRYRALDGSTTTSKCQLSEVRFYGTVALNTSSCNVMLHMPDVNKIVNVGTVAYSFDETPIVRSISPDNGTALGGTYVTLTGDNFDFLSTTAGSVSVAFSGVTCEVITSTATTITCITGVRAPEQVETSQVNVTIPGRGLAYVPDDVEFLYIDKWSALTSWRNQEPPVDGDVVWIPDGQVILLDVDTPLLTFFFIEGSLYLDRSAPSLKIDTYYMFIMGGYVEIGTEDEPHENDVTITVYGDRFTTIFIPFIGAKFLAVAYKNIAKFEMVPGRHIPSRDQGQLEIHGKKRLRTWTKVNSTIEAGQDFFYTLEPVDFAAGEQVVITGSEQPGGFVNTYGHEVMTIKETTNNGYKVILTEAFEYTHRSEVFTIEDRIIDMRIEVGLLTRNIVIQGEPVSSQGQLYGVHTISFLGGIYRLENTEVRFCGQAFVFGKYCTHSHMAGNMEGSYVKANSIHNSFQRAVTTHDTNHWEVRDNVAYDVMGHAYFVEDGSEQYNSITGNLGVLIHASSALLMSDLRPAIFWTATPHNMWRDNVAAHSAARGFWFELTGSEGDLCPVHMTVIEFVNHTFHSNSDLGLRIYPEWTPFADPCGGSDTPAPVYLYTMLSYRNGGDGMFSKKHGSIHHRSHTFVENGGDDVSIVKYEYVDYDTNPTFKDTLFVGSVDLEFDENKNVGHYAIFAPQDEYFYVSNSTFVNYGTHATLTGCNECLSGPEMNQGGHTYRFDTLKFVRSQVRIVHEETKKQMFHDLDGTLLGRSDSMLTRYYGHLNWPDCEVPDSFVYPDSILCGGDGSETRLRRMQMTDVTPSQLPYTDLNILSAVGMGEVYFLPLDTYGWVFPVATGPSKNYSIYWGDAGISAYTFTLIIGREAYMLETMSQPQYYDSVMMQFAPHAWDYNAYSFAITYDSRTNFAPINNTLPLTDMADSKFENNTLSVVVGNIGAITTAPEPFGMTASLRQCPPAGCPVPPVPTIGEPMLWSRAASWSSGRVPTTGQSVTIESNRWIVMDITPPKLNRLTIYGKLSFLSNATYPRTLTLQVNSIACYGYFHIIGEDNGSFVGDATVNIYGTKQTSLPVTMTETTVLGSKVIGVSGEMIVIGQSKNDSWVKLNATVEAGSRTIVLAKSVTWSSGDQIILSPTGYFTSTGSPWYTDSSNSPEEYRYISAVNHVIEGTHEYTVLTLNKGVNFTHICETIEGNSFCGAVGVLTRNVRFISTEQTTSGLNYGYGANIHVFDIINTSPRRYGSAHLENVEFRNFGKVNSDHYAIAMAHTDFLHPASEVKNCSFNSGYNFALRVQGSNGTVFSDNVAGGNIGGGVYFDTNNIDFTINHNLIIGSRQLPSILASSYPYTQPIAGMSIFSPNGVVTNNVVAGSEDQGFSIAMKLVTLPSSYNYLCDITRSKTPNLMIAEDYSNGNFNNNEAVGCRGGFQLIAMSPSENTDEDCAMLYRAFAWRNGHTGIMSLDTKPNLLIAKAVIAETHIGVNIHFYKSSDNVYAGVVNSTIINSLGSTGHCADLPDSTYLTGFQCQAFTQNDPFGRASTCGSIFADMYRRVGLLIPMATNKPRTCAIAGRFSTCNPPNTPDRLCELPWDKRYGLPYLIQYTEFHLHNNEFIGFESRSYNASSSLAGQCIPSTYTDRSVAVALNPTEIDYQPTIVSSKLKFTRTDMTARFGFDLGSYAAQCANTPCNGQDMLLWHDIDGTLGDTTDAGQFLLRNSEYTQAYPNCYEFTDISLGLYYCSSTQGQRQFTAIWWDQGPQVISPLITKRVYSDFNRTYASYGPVADMCAKRFFFSRYNFLVATDQVHYVKSTGTAPTTVMWRWEAPSDSDSAVIQFFIEDSLKVNVYVSDSSAGPFKLVSQGYTYPQLTDKIGYSQRNPQLRYLAVTVRSHSFYRMTVVPVAQVTIRMQMSIAQFFSDTFIANMATLLQIPASRIKITEVREGSVITDFEVSPYTDVANSTADYTSQISDLSGVTSNLTRAIVSDEISVTLNVTVLQVFATTPVESPIFDSTADLDNSTDTNSTSSFNITEYKLSLIQASVAPTVTLFTFPTSQPSTQPSSGPSAQPVMIPTSRPSSQPSVQPSSTPTNPTSQPSCQPSRQPSRQPTSKPTRQPSRQPTSRPSRQPSRQPTRHPFGTPTSQPSKQPYSKPSSHPTHKPTPMPTAIPSTASPSQTPTYAPSTVPSIAPSGPTWSPTTSPPTVGPTFMPSATPTYNPSVTPSATPSAQPSSRPTSKPTPYPSEMPTYAPSAAPSTQVPSGTPTELPTEDPSAVPSELPSEEPSVVPSTEPSVVPSSVVPSTVPSAEPSTAPTVSPSAEPSVVPSYVPSAAPSTASPSTKSPSASPTRHPTSFTILQVSFTCTHSVSGISGGASALNADTTAKNALLTVVKNNADFDGSESTITISSIVDDTRRKLSSAKDVEATGDVDVTYDISLEVYDTTMQSSGVAYSTFTSNLDTAMTSTAFSTQLQSLGVSLLSSASVTSAFTYTSAVETLVDNTPTQAPTTLAGSSNSDSKTMPIIIGTSIGAAVVVITVLFAAYYYYFIYLPASVSSSRKVKKVTIQPLQSDLNFVDMERLDTPVNGDQPTVLGADGTQAAAAHGNSTTLVQTADGAAQITIGGGSVKKKPVPGAPPRPNSTFFPDQGGFVNRGIASNASYMFSGSGNNNDTSNCNPSNESGYESSSFNGDDDQPQAPDTEHSGHDEDDLDLNPILRSLRQTKLSANGANAANITGNLVFQEGNNSIDSDTPIALHSVSRDKPVPSPSISIASLKKVVVSIDSSSKASGSPTRDMIALGESKVEEEKKIEEDEREDPFAGLALATTEQDDKEMTF